MPLPITVSKPQQILQQYWGYSTFRSLQEEVINSVLQGRDTLAIMPTGGGKSICFQVPALAMPGLCLVVSPLIALMKDQVEQLQRRGIGAIAVYSGLSNREIDIALDRCAYDENIKFLYLSPERLATDIFIARIKKLRVNLVAIDEAHCISQWGFDFRPAYLNIANLRQYLPKIPFIALTASATASVINDICKILEFANQQIFKKSFFRNNLSYSCLEETQKDARLLKILNRVRGSAIVYVATRQHARQTAAFLLKNSIQAAFYHGGLAHEERNKVQTQWIKNEVRVIVATNAFGMGIDKPDVRIVVHMDLPTTPEAYYQEAGRAGRDEQKAYAVLLYQPGEIAEMQFSIELNYPPLKVLQQVYQTIANYLKVAVGSSQFASYDFDLEDFCRVYKLKQREVFIALKILERENLLQLNHDFFAPSKLYFRINAEQLYEYQVKNATHDIIIKTILRMYGGEIFSEYVNISEITIAKNLKLDTKVLISHLINLAANGVLNYEQKKTLPQLTFLTPRQDASKLNLNHQRLQGLKKRELERLESMDLYIQNTNQCRSYALCQYFESEQLSHFECGICDNCLNKKKKRNYLWMEENKNKIFNIIAHKSCTTGELINQFPSVEERSIIEALRLLSDEMVIVKENNNWEIRKLI